MGPVKRLRIFAGPNGSGKTTIILKVKNTVNLGIYINADDIEQELKTEGYLTLNPFEINPSTDGVQSFFKKSTFSPTKLEIPDLWKHLTVKNNQIHLSNKITINSYLAADLAEFLRQSLLEEGVNFTYETVMSHKGKLAFMEKAKGLGYRVYLYFVATEDPDININRVNIRVAQDGHMVSPETIRSRYYRSLENLKDAVKISNRAYLFDNSSKVNRMFAEITNGNEVEIMEGEQIPNWFVKYLME